VELQGRRHRVLLPHVVNGIVYIRSYDHNIYALGARTGGLVWNYTTGNFVAFSPTVSHGIVYVGSNDHNVYALNAATGAMVWTYTAGDGVNSSPTVVN